MHFLMRVLLQESFHTRIRYFTESLFFGKASIIIIIIIVTKMTLKKILEIWDYSTIKCGWN